MASATLDVEIRSIGVARLDYFEANPRGEAAPGGKRERTIRELAESIGQVGILQPLLVTPKPDGRFTVVCGNRRLAAAEQLGLRVVPCVVRVMTPREAEIAALTENIQRQQLSPMEEARAMDRLLRSHGYTQRELGERLGVSQSQVTKRLQLLDLPRVTRNRLDRGQITIKEAMAERPRVVLSRQTATDRRNAFAERVWKIREPHEQTLRRLATALARRSRSAPRAAAVLNLGVDELAEICRTANGAARVALAFTFVIGEGDDSPDAAHSAWLDKLHRAGR